MISRLKSLGTWIAGGTVLAALSLTLPGNISDTGDAEAQGRRGPVYYAGIVLRGMAVTEKGLYFRAMGPVFEGISGQCPHTPVVYGNTSRRISDAQPGRTVASQLSGVTFEADYELFLPLSHPNYDMLSRQIQSYADNGYNKATSIGLTYRPTGEDCQAQIVGIGIGNHSLRTDS